MSQPFSAKDLETGIDLALDLAKFGSAVDPNPRVGAIIINDDRLFIGSGWHKGAGSPHAEVAAIQGVHELHEKLGTEEHNTEGSTLFVTLEPCNHQGFTGPCTRAIIEAGIKRVVYAVSDPGATSGGGAETLRAAGVEVIQLPSHKAEKLVRIWKHAIEHNRPYVTLKLATTLDGYVAAADGTSKWITGPQAREHAHRIRAKVGAIAVTTGTVLADDPALTARNPDGSLADSQPLVAVIGQRDVPDDARVRNAPGGFLHLRTHDVGDVLAALHQKGIRHLLVEGGPALATAFLAAGVVDEIHAYLAPKILGQGKPAVLPIGIETLPDALDFHTQKVKQLGNDIFIAARK